MISFVVADWSCEESENYKMNKTCVCETRMPRLQQSPKLAISSIKVMVKVTKSLILVSFEMVSLVEYACQL